MRIILDTNVISELRLPAPDPSVMHWFETIGPEQAVIASFTIAEIHYGIAMLGERDGDFATRLRDWVRTLVSVTSILPLDAESAAILGQMLAKPVLRTLAITPPGARRPRFGGDLMIAAVALANNAAIATRNIADFALIAGYWPNLTVINPWAMG